MAFDIVIFRRIFTDLDKAPSGISFPIAFCLPLGEVAKFATILMAERLLDSSYMTGSRVCASRLATPCHAYVVMRLIDLAT